MRCNKILGQDSGNIRAVFVIISFVHQSKKNAKIFFDFNLLMFLHEDPISNRHFSKFQNQI